MAKDQAKKSGGSTKVKYFPDQFDDEEVLYVFRKHPVVMRKGLVWGSLGLLVGPIYTLFLTYTRTNDPPTMIFFYMSFVVSLFIGGILFFPDWMSWHYSVFIVTNRRFIQITQKGFFHRSVVDMGLNQIQMVNYEISGLQETLLGFGTIMMQTFVGDLVIHYLHHPQKIQKHLLEILRQEGVQVDDSPASQTE